MSTATRRRAWIALYALVFQLLLLPAMPAQATTGQINGDMVLCTPEGLKTASADGSRPDHDEATFSCPRCDGILHAPVLPPTPVAMPTRMVAARMLRFVWLPDLAPPLAVAATFARGPPLQS